MNRTLESALLHKAKRNVIDLSENEMQPINIGSEVIAYAKDSQRFIIGIITDLFDGGYYEIITVTTIYEVHRERVWLLDKKAKPINMPEKYRSLLIQMGYDI